MFRNSHPAGTTDNGYLKHDKDTVTLSLSQTRPQLPFRTKCPNCGKEKSVEDDDKMARVRNLGSWMCLACKTRVLLWDAGEKNPQEEHPPSSDVHARCPFQYKTKGSSVEVVVELDV